jgi:Outer membrane protein beta-barrel domain
MRIAAVVSAAVLLHVAASAAAAQSWGLPPTGQPARFTLGAVGVVAAPRGEFQSNLGQGVQGGGFDAFGLMRLDRLGVLSLRVEGGGVWYGSESQRVNIFPRIGAKVVTTNSIGEFGVGPELAVPRGPVRPYVNAMYGVHYFSTSSSLEGLENENNSNDFSTTHQHDATSTIGFGGGLRVPVGPARWDFAIDAGTRYYRGGTAEYLKKGDIVDNPDGSLSFNTRRSRTDFQTFYLGASFGLHPSAGRRGY